jgi:hypothetical protein
LICPSAISANAAVRSCSPLSPVMASLSILAGAWKCLGARRFWPWVIRSKTYSRGMNRG